MSLNGAITNLASWAGNTIMPTMAGMFFAGAVYRKAGQPQLEGTMPVLCSGWQRPVSQ
jgi:hypothetical protein